MVQVMVAQLQYLKTTDSYTLDGRIIWYANCISTKLLQKRKRKRGAGRGAGRVTSYGHDCPLSDSPVRTKLRAKMYKVLHRGGNHGTESLILFLKSHSSKWQSRLLPACPVPEPARVTTGLLPLTGKQLKRLLTAPGKKEKHFRRDVCI